MKPGALRQAGAPKNNGQERDHGTTGLLDYGTTELRDCGTTGLRDYGTTRKECGVHDAARFDAFFGRLGTRTVVSRVRKVKRLESRTPATCATEALEKEWGPAPNGGGGAGCRRCPKPNNQRPRGIVHDIKHLRGRSENQWTTKNVRAADAKEVGVGNPAEETCCRSND